MLLYEVEQKIQAKPGEAREPPQRAGAYEVEEKLKSMEEERKVKSEEEEKFRVLQQQIESSRGLVVQKEKIDPNKCCEGHRLPSSFLQLSPSKEAEYHAPYTRLNMSLHKLDAVLDGDLDEFLDALILHDQTQMIGQGERTTA